MRRSASSSSTAVLRRGFTLIEITVVVVILALLATFVVPQLGGNQTRQFKVAVEQVSDLLTMYAQRENLGQKSVGLYHDRLRNWLVLMIYDTEDVEHGQFGQWREDPHVTPVKLPRFIYDTDVEIFADGDRIDASDFPLSNELGKDRPTIQIVLRGGGESALLTLYPYGVSPQLSSGHSGAEVVRARVDLDLSGRSREDW